MTKFVLQLRFPAVSMFLVVVIFLNVCSQVLNKDSFFYSCNAIIMWINPLSTNDTTMRHGLGI